MDKRAIGRTALRGLAAIMLVTAGLAALYLATPLATAVGMLSLGAAPLCSHRLRGGLRRQSLARKSGAAAVAVSAMPLAHLAIWNTYSPLFLAAADWNLWLHRAAARGYPSYEAFPLPLHAFFLAAALLPVFFLGILMGVLPLAAGQVASALASAWICRHPRALLPLAVGAGVLLATVWPMACEERPGTLPRGWFVDDTRRCSCIGTEFPDYPPGVSDGGGTSVCLGLEIPD